jgi:hypothetical protein
MALAILMALGHSLVTVPSTRHCTSVTHTFLQALFLFSKKEEEKQASRANANLY